MHNNFTTNKGIINMLTLCFPVNKLSHRPCSVRIVPHPTHPSSSSPSHYHEQQLVCDLLSLVFLKVIHYYKRKREGNKWQNDTLLEANTSQSRIIIIITSLCTTGATEFHSFPTLVLKEP